MSEKGGFRVGVGAPSLLMVLVVLSLTVLGVMSLSSSSAELRLTERCVRSSAAYYAADAEAQRRLADVDGLLVSARAQAGGDQARYDELVGALNDPEGRLTLEGGLILFAVKVDEARTLEVSIRVLPLSGGARYQIERYALVTEDDEPLNDDLRLLSEAGMPEWM